MLALQSVALQSLLVASYREEEEIILADIRPAQYINAILTISQPRYLQALSGLLLKLSKIVAPRQAGTVSSSILFGNSLANSISDVYAVSLLLSLFAQRVLSII